MLIYLSIFLFLILFSTVNLYVDKKKLISIYIAFSIFLVIFTGFRYYLGGSDYYVYKEYFDNIPNLNRIGNFEYFIHYEIGYKYLNSIIKSFTYNSIWLFAIITIITLPVLLILNYKYCTYPFFTMTFYMYKTFFYTNFVAMRQSIAMTIFFISIKYIIKGDFKKYCIFIFLATLFHSSAIVLLFLYFVRNLNMKRLKFLHILLIGFLLMIISQPLIKLIYISMSLLGLSNELIDKVSDISISLNLNLHVIESIIIYFIFAKNFKIQNKFENIIYNLFLSYIILTIGFSNQVIFIRIAMYFYFIIMIFMSLSLSKNQNWKYKQILMYTLMLIFFMGYVKYLIQFDNGCLLPYKTFIFNN